jgi:hypothetical protein
MRRINSRVEMAGVSVQFSSVADPAPSRVRLLLPVLIAGLLSVAGLAALLAGSRSYVTTRPAAEEPYNLMVAGFRSGHAWLAKDAPPELAKAATPYDFATYRPYLGPPWSLIDLSYYRGRLYAYFGVTPAVVLFWPYRLLTGAWLHQAYGVLLFCVVGYAVLVGLGVAAWRRYFPQVGAWAGAAIALLMGSVTTLPVFVVRPGLYEVAISCAFAFVMLTLAALWNAWHRKEGRVPWLAAASLAYGLAVGARPSLLFGAVILFVPTAAVLWARVREGGREPWLGSLLAAFVPISAVGAGLAAYNQARFDSPFQFGHIYQLSGNDVLGTRAFDPRYFWDNFRLYFMEPLRWHKGFPWVWEPEAPRLTPGHLPIEFFFGVLTNLPILLAAALVPLAWAGIRTREDPRRPLIGITAILALLFLGVALPICCFAGATSRYLLDFVPALTLLALLGFLRMESLCGWRKDPGGPVLTTTLADLSGSRSAPVIRVAMLAALLYSVAVSWLLAYALSGFYRGAERGFALLGEGRVDAGIVALDKVSKINPDFRGQAELAVGTALLSKNRTVQAVGYLELAAQDEPGVATAHFNLGKALLALGKYRESAEAFRTAAALDPTDAEAEADLGLTLSRAGKPKEGIEHLKAALRIDPTLEQVRKNLQVLEWATRASAK